MPLIRGCDFPDELYYDRELNLWLKPISSGEWQVGITQFGGALTGDIYMFNPKPTGREIELDKAFALIEVAKTILPVRTPFAAVLTAANEELCERPIRICRKPYESWLVHLKALEPDGVNQVLISGQDVTSRALELMDLNAFEDLEAYKKSKGMLS